MAGSLAFGCSPPCLHAQSRFPPPRQGPEHTPTETNKIRREPGARGTGPHPSLLHSKEGANFAHLPCCSPRCWVPSERIPGEQAESQQSGVARWGQGGGRGLQLSRLPEGADRLGSGVLGVHWLLRLVTSQTPVLSSLRPLRELFAKGSGA